MDGDSARQVGVRLAAISMLIGVTMSSEAGASTFPAIRATPWVTSDASTCYRAAVEATPSVAELDLVLAEVRTSRAILAARELLVEPSLGEYLRAVGVALDVYDHERKLGTLGREVRLATSLAVARTAFQDVVSRLPSWLAITRATGKGDRFTGVPHRFVTSRGVALRHEEQLDEASLVAMFDLDAGV